MLGYPGIAAMMGIGCACIPLPSELVMLFSGSLVSDGHFNFHVAALIGSLGSVLGSVVAYYAGMVGGRPFLEKYGRFVLIKRHDMDKADRLFSKHGEAVVFFGRLVPVVRAYISFPAGISRMNFTRFLIYTFIGSMAWCYGLTYLGMKLGDHWRSILVYFHKADAVIIAFLVLAIAVYLYHHLKPEKASAESA
jgi:membrane protein DedA with SNARE-associated domain